MATTQLHTVEHLLATGTKEANYELIEGELVPMVPPNLEHADLQGTILFLLKLHTREHDVGYVVGETSFVLGRNPDTVLAPDVAFITKERWPDTTIVFAELAPDLAVEIVSPDNIIGELTHKIDIYLDAGVRAVWIPYPRERQLVVHGPDGPPHVFAEGDHVDGGEVVPGLSLPVADLFA